MYHIQCAKEGKFHTGLLTVLSMRSKCGGSYTERAHTYHFCTEARDCNTQDTRALTAPSQLVIATPRSANTVRAIHAVSGTHHTAVHVTFTARVLPGVAFV